MKNKILVKIIVPEIDEEFDVFLPVNEIMWKVKKLVSKLISDLTGQNFDFNKEYVFVNANTNQVYKENDIIIDTDIRNTEKLLLISINENKL